jgi:hypothetical protein
LAFALHRDGKTAEAIALLKAGHPAVKNRAELDAWAKLLEKHPKWMWD